MKFNLEVVVEKPTATLDLSDKKGNYRMSSHSHVKKVKNGGVVLDGSVELRSLK